jgi:hypothetical protein
MKTVLAGIATLGLIVLIFLLPRGSSAPVPVPPSRLAFLVRLGIDGKTDADWSGSVANATRVSPWQFD